jgi:hypothetical protein
MPSAKSGQRNYRGFLWRVEEKRTLQAHGSSQNCTECHSVPTVRSDLTRQRLAIAAGVLKHCRWGRQISSRTRKIFPRLLYSSPSFHPRHPRGSGVP